MAGGARCTRKLKQWMIEQVDSEKYPGLVWEDRKLGMFRIPWKHAGKQDYRHDEDAAIFKAWAKFKGKYKDGDKVDPATWKTRLRCALNKSSEFEEVPQRSQLDISEPFKVYKIVDDTTVKKKPSLAIDLSTVKLEGSRSIGMESSQPSSPSRGVGTLHQAMGEDPPPDSQQMDSESSCDPSSGSEMSTSEESSTEIPTLELTVTPNTEALDNYTVSIISSVPTSLPEKGPNSMVIAFRYSGVEVRTETIRHGCKISSSAPLTCSENSFGSQGLEKLRFPETNTIASPEKRRATEELLTFLERGVMLDSNANGIFVQRLCQGRVFWTGPCAPQPNQTNKLEREKVEKLFDRKKFEQDMEFYQTSGGGVMPQYRVTLCFGEELTEADGPAEKLITVQVYQVAAKQLVDRELELQAASTFLLSQLGPEHFSERLTHAFREASSSLYGIS
ncbi:interferon regulatory factor 8-like isoform X2 [Chiloscyllium punctatum]|uniref:interferon regulatory factor 8-like isoform X2 n=1 Tax=Chiloscyllium punctatum TaxID=137246 RepID=UPI003B63534D